ncbi:MAG: GNAT family N-acetyltransferase [Hyphomicrobiaceae bacterium]|nr:GNAT family N-acetyltransferase [Hyphomicrobiaceae bacterium]
MGHDAPQALAQRQFHATAYDLGTVADGDRVTLTALAAGDADVLGRAFAAMNPWLAYRTPPDRLAAFLAGEEHDCSRRAIRVAGELAGAIVVRSPWLHGPYLQFLGLLPGRQAAGVGSAALAWMEREAPAGTRNLWLCVSAINTRARAFYERRGFVATATMDGLAADHMAEILMRKRLAGDVH